MCDHSVFKAQANVTRLTDSEEVDAKITGYRVDLEVHCAVCYMPFKFIGLPGGYSPSYPTVNVEETEARMPIKPV